MSKGSPDFLQLAFLGGAALLVFIKAWHGWRVGIVRQILGIVALLTAYLVGYFGGGFLGPRPPPPRRASWCAAWRR